MDAVLDKKKPFLQSERRACIMHNRCIMHCATALTDRKARCHQHCCHHSHRSLSLESLSLESFSSWYIRIILIGIIIIRITLIGIILIRIILIRIILIRIILIRIIIIEIILIRIILIEIILIRIILIRIIIIRIIIIEIILIRIILILIILIGITLIGITLIRIIIIRIILISITFEGSCSKCTGQRLPERCLVSWGRGSWVVSPPRHDSDGGDGGYEAWWFGDSGGEKLDGLSPPGRSDLRDVQVQTRHLRNRFLRWFVNPGNKKSKYHHDVRTDCGDKSEWVKKPSGDVPIPRFVLAVRQGARWNSLQWQWFFMRCMMIIYDDHVVIIINIWWSYMNHIMIIW